MKILIITQYFYPENFKSNDMAFELTKRGHDVTVLTGLPNYPEGKIYKGYGITKNRTQLINNTKVVRSLLVPRGSGGGVRLFINYLSFACFGFLKALSLALKGNKYDAVIIHEPSPITQFIPSYVFKIFHRTPIYFWVMDLWPESLEVAGGIRNPFILGFFRNMVKRFYQDSHKILITSKGFTHSIIEKGDFHNKLIHFPNWAEDEISKGRLDYPIPELPSDKFIVMFAGNMGEAQDLDSIMQAMVQLKSKPEIHLVLVGDGRKLDAVRSAIHNYGLESNVSIMGRFPIEAMASFFHKADVMLVTLKDDPIFNLTVPAKIQAYMSASKPIVAMINGEGAEIVAEANCGISVSASDYKSLADVLIKMSSHTKEYLTVLGSNGRKYYLQHYQMRNCITHLEEILLKKP